MSMKEMNIVVLLREVCDPFPPVKVGPGGGMISDRGLRRLLNPADLTALEEALRLARSVDGQVTAVTIGPSRQDDLLRLARSMGAARTIRAWDHDLEDGDSCSDSLVLSRIQEILRPDLLLSGSRLLDRGDDPAPRMAAARNGRACVSSVVTASLKDSRAEIERKSDRGARQKVVSDLPCTLLYDVDACEAHYPSHQAIMAALETRIEVWGLPELGLPGRSVGAAGAMLPLAEFGFPRQQPVRVVTPDAELPAFDRILALLSGGIKPREGRTHVLSTKDTADKLLKIFEDEGLLGENSR